MAVDEREPEGVDTEGTTSTEKRGGEERDSTERGAKSEPARSERKKPQNVDELFLEAIPARAKAGSQRLKERLLGRTHVSVTDKKIGYTIDWTKPEISVVAEGVNNPDCSIEISERDLLKVMQGELNPQILMLSHRVVVTGKTDHAIYVFNLIAPPAQF